MLSALPQWFGVPEAVDEYVAAANRSLTLVAESDGDGAPVGLLTLVQHAAESAEIFVMGVVPGRHRQGLGRRMIETAEARLGDEGVRFLQVKTLSPKNPDPGYAVTRAFYRACGFTVLEEFPELWDPENPALQLIKLVGESPGP